MRGNRFQEISRAGRNPAKSLGAGQRLMLRVIPLGPTTFNLPSAIADLYSMSPIQASIMVRKLTDTMVSIEGENMRGVTWVYVEDVKEGCFGIGGQTLTAADVHRLQRGEQAA